MDPRSNPPRQPRGRSWTHNIASWLLPVSTVAAPPQCTCGRPYGKTGQRPHFTYASFMDPRSKRSLNSCDHELIVMGSQCSGKKGTHGYSTTTMNLWRGHMERTGQRQAKPFRLSWTQGATHHDNQEEGRGPITSHRGCYQCRRLQHHHNVLVGGHMERQASANTSPMHLSWTQGANVH
ncbi:MAG: hypothetical protein J3Q66DRAFT_46300 [Benniella sp.]|nr:MAG: hypothetical protein J3Q66DRAFT_46300 [Benniella sp.]